MTAQAGDTPFPCAAASELPPAQRKQLLRRQMQQRRAALDVAQRRSAARCAARHLSRSPLWRRARRVALLLAFGGELQTEPLIRCAFRSGLQVFVPRLHARRMRFARLRARSRLRRNRYGIAEPVLPRYIFLRRLDFVLVPLTAFDAQGRRLGTGGGFYDRSLPQTARPRRIGWAYALQEAPEVPAEPWDLTLHAVCTERGLHRF